MAVVEILIGTVAAGKSTYSKTAATKGKVIVNDDAIVTAVHGGVYELYSKDLKWLYKTLENTIVTTALALGKDVVIDRGVNLTAHSRRRFIGLAHSLDCTVTAVVFPMETAEIHAARRYQSDCRGNSYEYWLQVAEFHLAEYEPPMFAEGFDDIRTVTWEQIRDAVI